MQRLSIVEAYVSAAMEQAEVEQLEDGTLGAYVPACKGVLAFGADIHEYAAELYRILEDWVKTSLVKGHQLPIIGGIDLNTDASHILATYHRITPATTGGDFFSNEEELLSALSRRGARPSRG